VDNVFPQLFWCAVEIQFCISPSFWWLFLGQKKRGKDDLGIGKALNIMHVGDMMSNSERAKIISSHKVEGWRLRITTRHERFSYC